MITTSQMRKRAKDFFLSEKPAPNLESQVEIREGYTISSLSHCLNDKAVGYEPLPEFPEVAPDSSVRDVCTCAAARGLSAACRHGQVGKGVGEVDGMGGWRFAMGFVLFGGDR